ncbi:hypothetical protein CYPRO_1323 [Cyclonatronum proteinivorum]|uniref:Uncharacterized protein n=1 Tax=Cyclonatronum proteinivorum TaxID=1457365 RepID=A0A345UJC8_9BACT|nr:hypothetical protein CYPRO_1323 [Cyclonatronum proteinivorum]
MYKEGSHTEKGVAAFFAFGVDGTAECSACGDAIWHLTREMVPLKIPLRSARFQRVGYEKGFARSTFDQF